MNGFYMLNRAFCCVALLCLSGAGTRAAAAGVVPEAEVLGYLEQLVEWQRDAAVIAPAEEGARELIFRDTVKQNGLLALKAGFAFARAEASIAPEPTIEAVDAQSEAARMRQHTTQNAARIAALRSQLARGGAGRAGVEGQLKLALAEQELYDTIQANFSAASQGSSASFSAKISNLQRGVPEMMAEGAAASTPATTNDSAATPPRNPNTSSLIGLSSRLFALARKQRELGNYLTHATQVEQRGSAMLKTLRSELDGLLTTAGSMPTAVDARLAEFRHLARVVAPLAETNVWMRTSITALTEWRAAIGHEFNAALKGFAIRLAVLLATLAVPLLLGEAAERAINRYVADAKRNRQAHNARRIAVGFAVLFILLMNFISDFSSFATFAGFLTAGIAVALQGVLLSLVAHFFFYGRYGVRAGDRVRVNDVIGDIMQIGMVRFYLRELETADDGTMAPTGKIVAFPNSILFQPSAFYKYV